MPNTVQASPATRRTKFAAAVRREQRAQGCDYQTAYQTALAEHQDLVGVEPEQAPQFGNEKFKGVSERRERFQAAVKAEMDEGTPYDVAFRIVSRSPAFANTKDRTLDLAGGGERRTKLRELLVATATKLGLDLDTNYNRIWNITAKENPDFFASMIQPSGTPKPNSQKDLYGGKLTETQPHSGSSGRSQTFNRPNIPGDQRAENPAQRAARLASK